MSYAAPKNGAAALYERLQERILERDQVGASTVYHELIRAERPLAEIMHETVRIHAPYTHVPYHQRIDNGFPRFVNNDHCLLSARVSLRLPELLPAELQYLAGAQTIWYVPTALDPWNQLLGHAPGHYGRRVYQHDPNKPVPKPTIHWADQEPEYLEGPFDERLNHWLTLVEQGQVLESYRVFLGLFEDRANRPKLLAHLAFAGLIDVQDRMLMNRSYTTGHKSYRARATIELGNAVGWDNAHDILYAGVPDMAVGPRWHSAYEMACQISWNWLAEDADKMPSSLAFSPSGICEERLLNNNTPLTSTEVQDLTHALLDEHEPAYMKVLTDLLLKGKDPKQIIDTIQVASARVILQTGEPANFSMPQHCFEYTNTVHWFFNNFQHPHRLKLLYVAGSFLNQAAWWVKNSPGNGEADTRPPQGASALSSQEILRRMDEAILAFKPVESVAWTRTYLEGGYDRKPLVQALALDAAKLSNDTHNQELASCLLEDYLQSKSPERETLLLACAQHTAGHAKYGDTQEAYRRLTEALHLSC